MATPWVCWGGNFFNTETQRTQRMYSQSQRLQERPKGLAQRLRPSKHSGSSLWKPLGRSVTLGVLYLCDFLSVLCVSVLKKWWEYRVTQKCGLNAYTYLQKTDINLFWWHIFVDFVPLAHPQIFKNRYSRSYFWKIFGDFCLMQHMTE